MVSMAEQIEKAALLHDVGKLILRARPERRTHSAVGVDFLKNYAAGLAPEVLRAVGHHHAADISGAQLAADDISYIIYEADNIAAGADRRARETDGAGGFAATQPLESVFNAFGDRASSAAFRLGGLLENGARYPVTTAIAADRAGYESLTEWLESNLRRRPAEAMTPTELLQILEGVMTYIPSSTAQAEHADISLYDHVKLTAAIAVAMYYYLSVHGITDYRTVCYLEATDYRKKDMYLLVSGDMSGIQEFIYTIPSKGALKSLRGRSLYLELMLEHIADELLATVGISRSALLYTGGGHFYMLLPNTERVQQALAAAEERINAWLLEHYGTRLYLALAHTPCSAAEFLADGAGVGAVFRRVSELLATKKLQRYNAAELAALFDPQSHYNRVEDARECAICHLSATELVPYNADDAIEVCPSCHGLYELGQAILAGSVLAITRESVEGSLALPSLTDGDRYLVPCTLKELEALGPELVRCYVKNDMQTGEKLATHLFVGDYVRRGDHGEVLDFGELAARSGSGREGIKRLGVLRADVDNLGAAFMMGFRPELATLSRTVTLSRELALFFKNYINELCAGRLNGAGEEKITPFSLFGTAKPAARNVHIVYSGGDDIFLVGAWDDLLELAVDIHRAFTRYTSGKLTFSAGLGLFHVGYPIAAMAREAGALEDMAKNLPGKNAIALFGVDSSATRDTAATAQCYSWPDFISGVCGEKLAFLREHFAIFAGSSGRLAFGKGLIYRLMELLRGEGIDLARLAYTIARLEPKGEGPARQAHYTAVRNELYQWSKTARDRRELVTALQLVIYGLRDKGEL